MTISIRLFAFAMAFGLFLAAVYWFDTRHAAGTVFLAMMGLGFIWVTSYLFVSRQETQYDGDEERAPSELAGEQIGVVSRESPWPIVLAMATAALLIGVVLHPMLAAFGSLAFLIILWELAREST